MKTLPKPRSDSDADVLSPIHQTPFLGPDTVGRRFLIMAETDSAALLATARRRHWNSPEDLSELSLSCFAAGHYEEAETLCRRILELRPNDEQAGVNLSAALIEQNRLSEAEQELLALRRRCPRSSHALANLSRVHFRQDRPRAGLAAARQALALDPNNVHALQLLYAAGHETDRLPETVRELEKLAASASDAWVPLLTLAQHYHTTGDEEAALHCFRGALERSPNSARVLHGFSGFLGETGRLGLLIEVVENARRAGPVPPEAAYNLARAYAEIGRPDLASEVLGWLWPQVPPPWHDILLQLREELGEAPPLH